VSYAREDIVHRPWTVEEDEQLRELHAAHGPCWARISRILKGRSDVMLKNRYNQISRVKDSLVEVGIPSIRRRRGRSASKGRNADLRRGGELSGGVAREEWYDTTMPAPECPLRGLGGGVMEEAGWWTDLEEELSVM
jgi:hypothetical protein